MIPRLVIEKDEYYGYSSVRNILYRFKRVPDSGIYHHLETIWYLNPKDYNTLPFLDTFTPSNLFK